MLKDWQGSVEINGKVYDSIKLVINDFKVDSNDIHIKLHPTQENRLKSVDNNVEPEENNQYRVTVKKYMTQKATPEFDFMAKWNNDNPMPLRTMVGTVEKETRGMVYMKLHGMGLKTCTCMRCGRELTNPVSRMYGIGPECMQKLGLVRDINEVEAITEDLVNVEWEGWIIKSAIMEQEVV